MFFSSLIINAYDSIVKIKNAYDSIFVSVAQFYCELSMTQALFFVQADQICGRLAAVLTAARTGCAWAPSLLLRVVSSACPAAAPAVRPSRSARPAARPAVLPCPGPAVPLLLRSARPALLRQSGGHASALPAASKKLRHPAGGSAPAASPAHGAELQGRQASSGRRSRSELAGGSDQGAAQQTWPGGRSREGGQNVVTTTISYTGGNFRRIGRPQLNGKAAAGGPGSASGPGLPCLCCLCPAGMAQAAGWYAQQRLNTPKNRRRRTVGGGVASWRTLPAAGPAPAP